MKLTNLAWGVAGYVLGAKAGRGRYDQIARLSRRVGGSQTVQSTAGVVQAQVDQLSVKAKHLIGAKLSASTTKRDRVDTTTAS